MSARRMPHWSRWGGTNFFRIFEENELAFLRQDETEGGKTSRFNRFVERNGNKARQA